MKSSLKSIFISVNDVKIERDISVEEMLKHSKEVMTTMGEWELTGITVTEFQQPTGDGEIYGEIRFSVRNNSKPFLSQQILHFIIVIK